MDKQIFVDYVRRLYNLEGTIYHAATCDTSFYFRLGHYKMMITIPDNEIMNKDAVRLFRELDIVINERRINTLKVIIETDNWNKDNFS